MHPYLVLFGLNIPMYDLMQILGFILAACYCLAAGVNIRLGRLRLISVILIIAVAAVL